MSEVEFKRQNIIATIMRAKQETVKNIWAFMCGAGVPLPESEWYAGGENHE